MADNSRDSFLYNGWRLDYCGDQAFDNGSGAKIFCPPGAVGGNEGLIKLINSFSPFTRWLRKLNNPLFIVKKIIIHSIDMFGPRVGFMKVQAEVTMKPKGFNRQMRKVPVNVPGIAFLRGDSVAVLIVIKGWEHENENVIKRVQHIVLVNQPRIPVGDPALAELPAGIMDSEKNVRGVALNEIKEETDLEIDPKDLIEMTSALGGKTEVGMRFFTSPGGIDEAITFFMVEKEHNTVDETLATLKEINRKSEIPLGNADEGEQIFLTTVRLDEAFLATNDMKVGFAVGLYREIQKKRKA